MILSAPVSVDSSSYRSPRPRPQEVSAPTATTETVSAPRARRSGRMEVPRFDIRRALAGPAQSTLWHARPGSPWGKPPGPVGHLSPLRSGLPGIPRSGHYPRPSDERRDEHAARDDRQGPVPDLPGPDRGEPAVAHRRAERLDDRALLDRRAAGRGRRRPLRMAAPEGGAERGKLTGRSLGPGGAGGPKAGSPYAIRRRRGRVRAARDRRRPQDRPMMKHLTAAALAACLLSLAPAASAAVPAPPPHATAEAAPTFAKAADRHTAQEIRAFLRWFYDGTGPSPYQREHWTSDYLKAKQAETPDHDVILCAQNEPVAIEVGPVTVAQSAGFGWATVTTSWAGGARQTLTAYVALDSDPIELHDVVCG
ncbi:predicted protein [Streptomyces albidoflavus]|nr:predicted protein [Streptomyces albidoflavus]